MKCMTNNLENTFDEYHVIISCPCRRKVYIYTNSYEVKEYLRLKYGVYFSLSKQIVLHEAMHIRVIFENSIYSIVAEDGICTTKEPFRVLESIMSRANPFNDSVFLFHGAAIAKGGKAFLFLAPTSVGKTTLTSFLVNKGFSYITDDCILLEKNTFFTIPYSTPMMLREGGKKVLNKNGISFECLSPLDNGIDVRYSYIPSVFLE